MLEHTALAAAALLVLLVAAEKSEATADPPHVVASNPADGRKDVDPGLREIRVRFDQAMETGGYSVVGGGPLFPKVVGRVKWADERTLSIPVRLEEGHHYQLSINSQSFGNCRGKNGVSAVPFPLGFDTAGPASTRPGVGTEVVASRNREAVEVLRTAIDDDYSYRDLRHVDWPAQFAKYCSAMETAPTPQAFAEAAAKVLEPAGDLHVAVHAGDRVYQTFRGRVPDVNFDMGLLPRVVPGWEEHGKLLASGQFPGGPAYLLIRHWDSDCEQDLKTVFDRIAKAGADRGLIIDVRPNGGGSEPMAQRFAGRFVDSPRAYAKNDIRSGGRFHGPYDRILEPNPNASRYRGKIAVLMGPRCVSSNESFLLMMRTVIDCKLIGQRSRGASGNPKPVELPNDVTVYLSSWRDMLPDGSCIEGVGIAPDVEVRTRPGDFAARDPVLDAAVRYLSARR